MFWFKYSDTWTKNTSLYFPKRVPTERFQQTFPQQVSAELLTAGIGRRTQRPLNALIPWFSDCLLSAQTSQPTHIPVLTLSHFLASWMAPCPNLQWPQGTHNGNSHSCPRKPWWTPWHRHAFQKTVAELSLQGIYYCFAYIGIETIML